MPSPSASLGKLPDAPGTIVADRDGVLLQGPEGSEDSAAAAAVCIRDLEVAGRALGFSGLHAVSIRGASNSSTIAVRERAFLLSQAAEQQSVPALEKEVERWSLPEAGAPAREGWAALRDALVRGRLSDAIGCVREIEASPPLREALAGSEPLHREELDAAVESLLHGIASTIARDGVAGGRWLRDLAAPTQRNLSIRWLAHFWSSRAALESGELPAAGVHAREALSLAAHLDPKARAMSCWAAAEVFAQERDPRDARARLAEAQEAFTRTGDGWGLSRARLAEARMLAAMSRDAEADQAAGLAAKADPSWDEPHLFQARRLLARGDAAAAAQVLAPLQSLAAHFERALFEAAERRTISAGDLGQVLQAREAPANAEMAAKLERIATAAPTCAAVHDSLAWLFLRLGRYDEAKYRFNALLAQQPTAPERLSLLAGLGRIVATSHRAAEKPERKERPSPSAPPQAASNVVLRGKLAEVPLADLFEFLRMGKRTGVLLCNAPRASVSLRFRNGFIIGASSGAEAEKASLEKASLKEKAELLVRQILQWKAGQFSFERDAAERSGTAGGEPGVDPQALLLKVLTESDEASRGG